jgi:uncharacterized protein
MKPIVAYFSITFGVTWTFFMSAIVLVRGAERGGPDLGAVVGLLIFIGTMMPSAIALILTARSNGKAGVKALLQRILLWRVSAKWYLFALFFAAGIKLAVAVVCRAVYGAWPEFSAVSLGAMLVAIVFSTPFQAGEEIGWRGYALPRLAERIGLPAGSVVLGVLWAVWHLPLFFLNLAGNDEFGQSFAVWALGVTGLSVAMAWLYARTRGSLLLVMLMHSAVNNGPHFAVASTRQVKGVFLLHALPAAWLSGLLLACVGVVLLLQMKQSSDAEAIQAMC